MKGALTVMVIAMDLLVTQLVDHVMAMVVMQYREIVMVLVEMRHKVSAILYRRA